MLNFTKPVFVARIGVVDGVAGTHRAQAIGNSVEELALVVPANMLLRTANLDVDFAVNLGASLVRRFITSNCATLLLASKIRLHDECLRWYEMS